MRKALAQDFDQIYVLNLNGNVRKNPKLSGTTHNVVGIQVGGEYYNSRTETSITQYTPTKIRRSAWLWIGKHGLRLIHKFWSASQ